VVGIKKVIQIGIEKQLRGYLCERIAFKEQIATASLLPKGAIVGEALLREMNAAERKARCTFYYLSGDVVILHDTCILAAG
jgi:hypothetical protein